MSSRSVRTQAVEAERRGVFIIAGGPSFGRSCCSRGDDLLCRNSRKILEEPGKNPCRGRYRLARDLRQQRQAEHCLRQQDSTRQNKKQPSLARLQCIGERATYKSK